MINIKTEELIPLTQVLDIVPSCRLGKKLTLPTVYRWMAKGLETARIGGARYTTREAIQRFMIQSGSQQKEHGRAVKQPTHAVDRGHRAMDALRKRLKGL
jgi:hypothetical protein